MTKVVQVKQAVVLTAGLGERLRPLTATLPKPLIRVKGRAILSYVLQKLVAYGIEEILLNSHYLAAQIEQYMKTEGQQILGKIPYQIIYEPEILETGGAIKNMLPLLQEKFFVFNGDICWHEPKKIDNNYLVRQLANNFNERQMDGLLLLVGQEQLLSPSLTNSLRDLMPPVEGKNIKYGDFLRGEVIDNNFITTDKPIALIKRDGNHPEAEFFTGGQLLKKSAFQKMLETEQLTNKFSLNQFYDHAIRQQRLFGFSFSTITNGQFFHIGNLSDLQRIEHYPYKIL